MDAFRLRPARPDDAPRIADVFLSSRRAFLPWAPLRHADDEVRAWVREVLLPRTRVHVACDAGGADAGVRGFVSAQPAHAAGEPSWIEQLYVAPGHTARGVGSALLREALAGLPRPVRLHTFQANAGARRFYERHGFVAIAFGDGRDNEERCPDLLYGLDDGR